MERYAGGLEGSMNRSHVQSVMLIVLAVLALVVVAGVAPRAQSKADLALKAAMDKEVVDGDLKAAIELYRQIARGSDRALAARALIRMGQCYEKLGDAQARTAYEQVVREFADQKEAVEQARVLLSAGGRARQPESGITVQQQWVLPAGPLTEMRQPSPDGRYLPYTNSARMRLSLHDFTTGEDRLVLESPAGSGFFGPPVVSPDSKQIVYTRYTRGGGPNGGHDWELVVAGIDGSNPSVLLRDKQNWFQPRVWSRDGKFVLVTTPRGDLDLSLVLVSIADRSQRVVTTQGEYSSMSLSPDGRYVAAYRVSRTAGVLPGPLKLIPTDGGKEVLLFESTAKNLPPFWTPDGRNILFLSDRSGTTDLWSIGVSDGKPEGEPRLVRSGIGPVEPLGVTNDGSLYYKTSVNAQGDMFVSDLDPATGLVVSKPERINGRYVGSAGFPADWSRDGRFLAYTRRDQLEYNRSKIISIIIRSEATGEEREVFPVPAAAFNQSMPFPNVLKWFPDGRSLLATDFAGRLVFRQMDVQTGQVKVLLDLSDKGKAVFAPSFSPDGKTLFYVESGAGFYRVMRRNLENGDEKELYRLGESVGSIDDLSLSTDGRQLALVQANMDDKTESLIMVPAEGGSHRELYRSKMSINQVEWTRDDRHLLLEGYPEPSSPGRVWSLSIAGGQPQPSTHETGLTAVHPDGRRIAFSRRKGGTEEVWVIKNLLSTPAAPRK